MPVTARVLYELDADECVRTVAGRLGTGGGVDEAEEESVDLRGGGGGGAFFGVELDVVSRRMGMGGGTEAGAGAAAGRPVMYLDDIVSSRR